MITKHYPRNLCLERFHRRSSGGMATLAWPCGGFLGKTCPRQAWAWHPTRYSESETALMFFLFGGGNKRDGKLFVQREKEFHALAFVGERLRAIAAVHRAIQCGMRFY